MGAAASIPQYLDETTCRRFAGAAFDQQKFNSTQRSGRVSKYEFLAFAKEKQQPLERLQPTQMVYKQDVPRQSQQSSIVGQSQQSSIVTGLNGSAIEPGKVYYHHSSTNSQKLNNTLGQPFTSNIQQNFSQKYPQKNIIPRQPNIANSDAEYKTMTSINQQFYKNHQMQSFENVSRPIQQSNFGSSSFKVGSGKMRNIPIFNSTQNIGASYASGFPNNLPNVSSNFGTNRNDNFNANRNDNFNVNRNDNFNVNRNLSTTDVAKTNRNDNFRANRNGNTNTRETHAVNYTNGRSSTSSKGVAMALRYNAVDDSIQRQSQQNNKTNDHNISHTQNIEHNAGKGVAMALRGSTITPNVQLRVTKSAGDLLNNPNSTAIGSHRVRNTPLTLSNLNPTFPSPLTVNALVQITYSVAFARENPLDPTQYYGRVVKNDGHECHIDFGEDGTFRFYLIHNNDVQTQYNSTVVKDADGFNVTVRRLNANRNGFQDTNNLSYIKQQQHQQFHNLNSSEFNASSLPNTNDALLGKTQAIVDCNVNGSNLNVSTTLESEPEPDPIIDLQLWIHHDNSAHANRTTGQVILIEGKTPSGAYIIIRGVIEKSGEISSFDFEDDSKSAGTKEAHKGSYCILVKDIKGFIYGCNKSTTDNTKDKNDTNVTSNVLYSKNITKMPNKYLNKRQEIEERSNPRTFDTDIRLDDKAAATNREVILALNSCTGPIDVIFDPQRQGGKQGWYPRKKDMRGNGKTVTIPASFRSNNVGYMKLGDDMSAFGNQFLSLDGGCTFMNQKEAEILQSLGFRVRV